MPDPEASLSGEATFARTAKRRPASEVSLGDERTFGDGRAGEDTVIDDSEVVDLEARYKVEGTLGRGGMGAVMLATDMRLDRKVAIKRIIGEAADNRMAVNRFLTEAKAIAALNHPNIVQIYDYGRAKDGPFLIMEFSDGGSLLDRCRESAIPLDEAIDLACQLCDGLAKAHDLGIIHRDIKPANVLLTKDGIPKLTDFGLAKAQAGDHGQTMTGAVLGTPDFMPPEQRRDASLVDHRSDLWSLAATIYQMVTGRSPKIIRFDLLPAELTKVLGKALEDAKEARYQSARELRDALKTSLTAPAPAAAELGEGQCLACGVKNDSSRRFCRGCGEKLVAPCLSCSEPMPIWEQICGQCGTKQMPLLDERRRAMTARQAQAEGLVQDYDFDQAERLTVELRDEPDPRLKQLVPWATGFVEKIGRAREAQLAQAAEQLAEALKHEASFDYPSAIHALEQVPDMVRGRSLAGHAESVAAVLSRVTTKQSDVKTFESLIKARITSRELSGLLPHVERLRDLRPDRADVAKLRAQLVERQQKLVAQRDEATMLARGHLSAKDYESAIAVLLKVDGSVESPEVRQLRDAAEYGMKSLQNHLLAIGQAVSQKQFDGLMPKVEAALAIKPGHAELTKLLDSLKARAVKIEAGIHALLSQADAAFKSGDFTKASMLLERIPEDRRDFETLILLETSACLAVIKANVLAGFEGLPKVGDLSAVEGGDLKGLAIRGRSYLGEIAKRGLHDPVIDQWCSKCETAHEKREAAAAEAHLLQATLRRIFIGAAATAAGVLLVAAGLWVRSSWRAASIDAALARGDWQAALSLAPDSVDAIIGSAKAKLAAVPPDIDGAIADLERAEKLAPSRIDVMPPLAAAWLKRAHLAAERMDAAGTTAAVNRAAAAGAPAEKTSPLRAAATLIDAVAMFARGKSHEGTARAIEASSIDPSVAKSVLSASTNTGLKQAVAAILPRKFDTAISERDWESASKVAATALAIDTASSEWIVTSLASYPGGLSGFPVEFVSRLPPAVFASFPPVVVTAMPPIENSIGMQLKLLPLGTFTMGERGNPSSETPHVVTLTRAFYLGVYEVTNSQWTAVMGNSPKSQDDDRPVVHVRWEDASEFCHKLSALPEEKAAGRVYRLPTEAEWEYACRAGTTTKFSFGDDEELLKEFGWFAKNSGIYERVDQTHRVGLKKPNAWGFFDMHGNVWEWCNDWYSSYEEGVVKDPGGPAGGSGRVFRGGCWYYGADDCRSARRGMFEPTFRSNCLGFRVAMSLSGKQPQEKLPEAAAER